MSKYHVAEITRHAQSFAKPEHVRLLLEGYGLHVDVKELEEFIFVKSNVVRCSTIDSFYDLWAALLGIHKMQQHRTKKWSAFQQDRAGAKVHFDGPFDAVRRGLKRIFVEEEEENPAFTEEKIALYNSYFKILNDPDSNLPSVPNGAFFPDFSQEFNTSNISPANRTVAARAALIRIMKGEATLEDYNAMHTMNVKVRERQQSRGLPPNPEQFINSYSVIDILQKLVFPDQSVESFVNFSLEQMNERQLGRMNFLFQQVHDPERENYVFEGDDIDEFLRSNYNIDSHAKQRRIEFDECLGRLKNMSSEFNNYLDKQYAMLKRILKGAGTKNDYEMLSNFMDVAKPLQMLASLVIPKTDIAYEVECRKIHQSDARKALRNDIVASTTSLNKIESERTRLQRQVAESEQIRKSKRQFDVGLSNMTPEMKLLIANFTSSITTEISDVSLFNPAQYNVNFYQEQVELTNILTTEITAARNAQICSIFNSILHLRSLLSLRVEAVQSTVAEKPLTEIYMLFANTMYLENQPDLASATNDSLIRTIYFNLVEMAKEPFVARTNRILQLIEERIEFHISALSIRVDNSMFPANRVIQGVYIDVENVVETLKSMLRAFEFDKSLARENLFDILRETLGVYGVETSKINLAQHDKHFLIELVTELLNYEKSELFPDIPNIAQYQRIATAERNISTAFSMLWSRQIVKTDKTTSELEHTAVSVTSHVYMLGSLVSKNIALFSARFRHVSNFFNACITFEKFDSVQTYQDIYDRFALEYPETSEYMLESETELEIINIFLSKVIETYQHYANPVRALQILTWMDTYVNETLEQLRNVKERLSQPQPLPSRPEEGSLRQISGGTIKKMTLVMPTNAQLVQMGMDYIGLMDQSTDLILGRFESRIVDRNGAIEINASNAHYLIVLLAKMLLYIKDITVSDPDATLQKTMATGLFQDVDLHSLVVNINNDSMIFAAIRQNIQLLTDAQQRVMKAFMVVLLYNAYHYQHNELMNLYYTSGSNIPQQIDYSLTDSTTIPAGSTGEFMLRWKALLHNIHYIKSELYPNKNQSQLNRVIMQYLQFLSTSMRASPATEKVRMEESVTDETLKLELANIKDFYDKNHTPFNQVSFINSVENVVVNMLPFFREHELQFDAASKIANRDGNIDVSFVIPNTTDELLSFAFQSGMGMESNFHMLENAVREFQSMYTYHVNGEIVAYLRFVLALVDQIPQSAPVTMKRLYEAIRRTSVEKVGENVSASDVDYWMGLLRAKMIYLYNVQVETHSENLFLYNVVITMVVKKMKAYFIEHGVLAEHSNRHYAITLDKTFVPNLYPSTTDFVLNRLNIVATYLTDTFGEEAMLPIIWRYAKYIHAIMYLVIHEPLMRDQEKLLDFSNGGKFIDSYFGNPPAIITKDIISNIVVDAMAMDKEHNLDAQHQYINFIYMITSKMERFVESQFPLPRQEIRFGGKATSPVHFMEVLQQIERLDLWLIMIHYAQCIALGRAIVSLKYDVAPEHGIVVATPTVIVAIPDNYDVVSFVHLLSFNKNPEHVMLMLLSALSSVLSKHPNSKLHDYKAALKFIIFLETSPEQPHLRWLVADLYLIPLDAHPPERVVKFLSECIFLLSNLSSSAFLTFYGKEKTSIFLGLPVH